MSAVDGRPPLLFLCHRIPYPPDKGDKIRSWRWLQALSRAFRVHLGTFVDDPRDWEHRETVAALCEDLLLVPLDPRRARLRSLSGLLRGEALSLPYYRDRRLAEWVARGAVGGRFGHVFVFSSAMAQYALVPALDGARRVIDYVDVDSDKWRQYAERVRGPMRWVYRREARCLEAFDLAAARVCAASLFVSAAEAALFRDHLGADGERVTHVDNGVDSGWFDPALPLADPYPPGGPVALFTGAMDYWANVDAVDWFVRAVWPAVRSAVPDARFYVVGSRPAPAVAALAGDGVVVTGRVEDVRPYLRHARVVVAPMRIARGVQNKVLEGMSMARPVVVTPRGLEGIGAADGRELLVAEEAVPFAARVLAMLEPGAGDAMAQAARSLVRREHDWSHHCNRLVGLVAGHGVIADNDREP